MILIFVLPELGDYGRNFLANFANLLKIDILRQKAVWTFERNHAMADRPVYR